MKLSQLLFLGLMFLTSTFLSAQSIVGDWTMEGTMEDGTKVTNKISFKKDGTLTVDFGNDGTAEVKASYTVNGNQVSINATSKEDPCYGKVGVYKVDISGDKCVATLVEDPCDVRRGDGKPGTMTRVK